MSMGGEDKNCRAQSLNPASMAAICNRGPSCKPAHGRRGSETPPYSKRVLIAALVALILPKCLLCLAGYLAAGGALVELCGGAPDDHSAAWWVGGAVALMLLAGARWHAGRKRHDQSAGPHPAG
jgi:hypothetical protein